MPRYLSIIISFFLLFIVLITSFGFFMIYDNSRPASSISISDTLNKKIKPDQASVQLFISQTGTDITKLNKENDIITTKVIDFLMTNGVSKDKIKTNKNSFEEYQDTSTIGNVNTFLNNKLIRAETTIDVEFVNFDNNPNSILEKTLELGVSRYGQFSYKTKDIKKVCDDLELEVEKSVKAKAQQKIANLSGKIVRVQYSPTYLTGCDSTNSIPYYNYKASDTQVGQSQLPELMTGEQDIVAIATMTVDYK